MSKHTEGPWEYLDIGEIVRADDTDVTIAILNEGVGVTFDEAMANASLLVAAPEMLEALRSAVASLEQLVAIDRIPANNKGLRDARAAIAKAEGR